MDEILAEFGPRLRKLLEIHEVSQVELSRRTGIPRSAICEYLAGNYLPKQNNVYKIAVALGVKPSTVMGIGEDGEAILHPKKDHDKQLLDIFHTLSETAQQELIGCLQRKNLNVNELFEQRSLTQEERRYLDMFRELPEDEQYYIKKSIERAYRDVDVEAKEKGIG